MLLYLTKGVHLVAKQPWPRILNFRPKLYPGPEVQLIGNFYDSGKSHTLSLKALHSTYNFGFKGDLAKLNPSEIL